LIITVVSTTDGERDQWRCELLEHSWQQVNQPGELVRLVAAPPGEALPQHGLARVVRTRPWNPHPFLRDRFPPYNKAASILEWLRMERIDATILLMEADSVFLSAIDKEVAPGGAIANTCRSIPVKGPGPFGLGENYGNLAAYCVNRRLKLPRVSLPLLIHSKDLLKIAARWLELTGIIHTQVETQHGEPDDADRTAYAIAAAEYRVAHQSRKLAVAGSDKRPDRPVFHYRQPIESGEGKIIWDCETYTPWESGEPGRAGAGAGRKFLSLLKKYEALRESAGHLRFRRPRRRFGVREARVLDRMLLEIPEKPEPLSLNHSAAAIWQLCDDERTLADIAEVLADKYEVSRATLCSDIELAINQLRSDGAVDLDRIPA
jgi:hypothetical protein